MATARVVKIEGLKELQKALAELPRQTAKNTGIRTLKKGAKPIDDAASANAPEMTGKLETSVTTGTKLTRGQQVGGARLQSDGGFRSASKNYVEVHVGTSLSRGLFTEFGTYKDPPQMWFTRAFESTQDQALRIITTELAVEIDKSAKRLAKKRAKP